MVKTGKNCHTTTCQHAEPLPLTPGQHTCRAESATIAHWPASTCTEATQYQPRLMDVDDAEEYIAVLVDRGVDEKAAQTRCRRLQAIGYTTQTIDREKRLQAFSDASKHYGDEWRADMLSMMRELRGDG